MSELPSGTVTFLFTDVEGSTRLWEDHPDEMHDVMARHDEIVRDAIESHGGHVVKTTGDGFHAAFATARDALDAAMSAQRGLVAEPPVEDVTVKVRMGVHTGEARARDGDYYGSSVNRAARLMAVGHGGQIVCSQATADLARDALAEGVVLVDLGEHRLRDLSRTERLFQVNTPGLIETFAPLRSLDSFPGNLPAHLSSFVGREVEVAEISRVLREKRLVTLTGVGGVGKTRSGANSPIVLAGILNVTARGLAEHRPEPAAVIQGTVGGVLRRVTTIAAAPPAAPDPAHGSTIVAFIADARREATQLITAALGESRLRELRAEGAAMTEDQACAYARTHIDAYLAADVAPR